MEFANAAAGAVLGDVPSTLSAPWVDTHCHLDAAEFAPDREAVIAAASSAGVGCIVVPAVDAASWAAVQQLATAQQLAKAQAAVHTDTSARTHAHTHTPATHIHFALGIHPMYVDHAQDADLAALRQQLEGNAAVVAVGEIGLDYFVEGLDQNRQLQFFEAQLKLARDFELPVILHVRRAIDPILKQLRRFNIRGGIAHAFNGSAQQAEQFIERGFALGFGGAMTYPRALHLRALASSLPEESLVLETDAPDIPPAWLPMGEQARGTHPRRNTPAELPRIAQVLAELRQTSVEHVAAFTTRNARRVLPRLAK